jgi:putative secretion ATPase (PEP-CTERM system associated)
MYHAFFGLHEAPFNITPNPRFLFRSRSHQEALAYLQRGIVERQGFIAITGEVGTGKTLLCRTLLDHVGDNVRTALIFNSFMSELDLLRSINEDFGIATSGATRKEFIDTLHRFLIQEFSAGRNAVLIIDEAQNLAVPVLEQIRMLSNLETERGKLLQIVFVGQPEFQQQLASPELRQLNQRIALRYHLRPLKRQETEDYIHHRLVVAGSRGNVQFSRGAFTAIFWLSKGIPRAINLLCDRAILAAYVHGTHRINTKHIRQAWLEVQGQEGGRGLRLRWTTPWRKVLTAQSLVLALALTLAGGAWLAFSRPQPLQRLTMASNPGSETPWEGSDAASGHTPLSSGARHLEDGLAATSDDVLWRHSKATGAESSYGEVPPSGLQRKHFQATYHAQAGVPFVFPLPYLADAAQRSPVHVAFEVPDDEPRWLVLDQERLQLSGTAPLTSTDQTYQFQLRAHAEPGVDSRLLVLLTITGSPHRLTSTPQLPSHWSW